MLLVSDSVSDTWKDHLLMVEKNAQISSNLAKVINWVFYSSPGLEDCVKYCIHFRQSSVSALSSVIISKFEMLLQKLCCLKQRLNPPQKEEAHVLSMLVVFVCI